MYFFLPIAFRLRFLVFWVKMASELCVTFGSIGRYSLHCLQPCQSKDLKTILWNRDVIQKHEALKNALETTVPSDCFAEVYRSKAIVQHLENSIATANVGTWNFWYVELRPGLNTAIATQKKYIHILTITYIHKSM